MKSHGNFFRISIQNLPKTFQNCGFRGEQNSLNQAKMKQILSDYSPILDGKAEEIKKKVKELPIKKPLEKLQTLKQIENANNTNNIYNFNKIFYIIFDTIFQKLN